MSDRPRPLNAVLVKPAGPDCNMGCEYCFYCGKARLFGGAPVHRMSHDVLEETLRQACIHAGPQVTIAWQGGEPTLMGLDFFRTAVLRQRKHLRPGQRVLNTLQTNGLLIDRDWGRFLHEAGFLVGLSLDGPRDIHDHYRRTIGGGGTWQHVVDTLHLLLDERVEVNALTVVSDRSATRAAEIYAFLKANGLRHMQFIPCVERAVDGSRTVAPFSIRAEQYGRFLCDLFDCWCSDFRNGEPATFVRWFEAVLATYLGMPGVECTLRPECGDYVLVEHNGDVFSCDFFVEPAWRLGNVMQDDLHTLLNSPRQHEFSRRKRPLTAQCRACEWLAHCQGGCLRERVDVEGHSADLSYLCEAYRMFFAHSDGRFRQLVTAWQARQHRAATAAPAMLAPAAAGKVGRNDPCPCGSGYKYKRCCGAQR